MKFKIIFSYTFLPEGVIKRERYYYYNPKNKIIYELEDDVNDNPIHIYKNISFFEKFIFSKITGEKVMKLELLSNGRNLHYKEREFFNMLRKKILMDKI